MSNRGGRVSARVGVVFGALAGIALTVPFAFAFGEAYGSGGAGFLPKDVEPWLFDHGLLGGDSKRVYDRYGVSYFLALVLVTASLAVLARPVRGGRRVILVGLVTLCAGIFADYAVPNDVVGGVGFLFEGIGFVVVAVGVGLLVRERAGSRTGAGAAVATLACMVAGGALTGHIPGGPGLTILVGALAFALLADARSDAADVIDMPPAPH